MLTIYNLFKGSSNGKIKLERSRLWQLDNFCIISYSTQTPKPFSSISDLPIGFGICNIPRCHVSKNVKDCYKFSSHVTKEFVKINYYFDYTNMSLIYLITFKVCGCLYVDSATERYRFPLNNYKSCQRKAEKGGGLHAKVSS